MQSDTVSAPPHKWKQHFTLELTPVVAGSVWVHACSVGEVASIVPLIRRLLSNGNHVHLTVVTRTGFTHAQSLFGKEISQSWLPWDLPALMSRFVTHLKPNLLLLCETEFWPGMLKACKKQNVPIIGINTRISDRSFPKYFATRYLWRKWLAPIALFLAQSQLDATRLQQLGLKPSRIKAVGNLKFALQAPDVDSQHIRLQLDASGQRPILIIASTHHDEEAKILSLLPTWQHLCPDLLTLIVPRHPERFDEVAQLLQQQAIPFTRYHESRTHMESVILIDAMGVLSTLYTVADLVIIGGSIAPIGGHNPLEPAICGRGVITGPHIQNFRAVMQEMQQQGAAIVTQDCTELEATLSRLLQNPEELEQLHAHAALFMQQQSNVLERMWSEILPYLSKR